MPRFEALLARATSADEPLRVVVVGAGAAGVELAAALQYRLSLERQRVGCAAPLSVSLVSRGPILQGLTPYARRSFLTLLEVGGPGWAGLPVGCLTGACSLRSRSLFLEVAPHPIPAAQERHVQVHEVPGGVAAIEAGVVVLADGRRLPFEECMWTTQASAAPWLAETGLPVDAAGFLAVNDCLQSDGGPPNVFAAGDVASSASAPRPKAGVFAVRAVSQLCLAVNGAPACCRRRAQAQCPLAPNAHGAAALPPSPPCAQGAPLVENLRRSLAGQPLKPWTPQRTFLSLLSAGDKYAVATKGPFGKLTL